MKLQEAKQTTVFEIEDGVIKEVNLYEKMSRSIDETTTPRGVAARFFIEEETVSFYIDDVIEENKDDYILEDYDSVEEMEEEILNDYVRNMHINTQFGNAELSDFCYNDISDEYTLIYYVISTWGFTGNKYQSGKHDWTLCFPTEEEAEEKLFEFLKVDFEKDWDNSCNIFYTFEEAEQVEAERMNVSVDVYRSVKRKEEFVKEQRALKAQKEREEINASRHNLAIAYANTIPLVNGETKKETQTRISKLLGRIEKDVFWRVVQIVRLKQNN